MDEGSVASADGARRAKAAAAAWFVSLALIVVVLSATHPRRGFAGQIVYLIAFLSFALFVAIRLARGLARRTNARAWGIGIVGYWALAGIFPLVVASSGRTVYSNLWWGAPLWALHGAVCVGILLTHGKKPPAAAVGATAEPTTEPPDEA